MNGAYFASLRRRVGLSLADMAKHLRKSVAFVSLMERGRRSFSPEAAAMYERVYERYRKAGYAQ